MPAASTVVRCAASTPLKNRSPWSAGRPCAPAPPWVFLPSGVCPRRGRRCRALAKLPPPTVQQVGIDLKGPADLGRRGALLQPFHCRQLEFLRESPSRQTHHSSSVQWILSLICLSHFWGQVHKPSSVSPGGAKEQTGPYISMEAGRGVSVHACRASIRRGVPRLGARLAEWDAMGWGQTASQSRTPKTSIPFVINS